MVVVATTLLVALGLSSCQCALKDLIDKGAVTARGVQAINDVNAKAAEGYDVRVARAKWLEALTAYNQGDYELTNRLIDDTYTSSSTTCNWWPSVSSTTARTQPWSPACSSGRRREAGPGPSSSSTTPAFGTAADFSDVALVFVDRGYLVFNPDYRGSGSSEGQHELAKGEVDDVISGIDYVKSQGLVKDNRVGLYGQSHGRRWPCWPPSRDPDIKAVVEEAGFSDAVDLYYNVVNNSDPNIRAFLNDVEFMRRRARPRRPPRNTRYGPPSTTRVPSRRRR